MPEAANCQYPLDFNGDISGWDVGNVVNMTAMFKGAIAFNQDISNWNVASVTNMTEMFSGATAFNQHLNGWNVANVQDMESMFDGAVAFNGGLTSGSSTSDLLQVVALHCSSWPLGGWWVVKNHPGC